jgi:predicted 3-demethylubiquinone-9 3-methyltransferase (glyoxalase superfamily)
MNKIIPYLWFDTQAEEAANFYVSVFGNSKITGVTRYSREAAKASGQPEGSVMLVEFELAGQQFVALNGGPIFTFSPAVSFFVSLGSADEIDGVWKKLLPGGTVRMELGKYPFGEKYGWIEDKHGVSWQLYLEDRPQKIAPALMFAGENQGRAEEAMSYYASLFENSGVTFKALYDKTMDGPEGQVAHATFTLDGYELVAFDTHIPMNFTITPAISFLVNCRTQKEIDEFWAGLSAGGHTEQCGWLVDKFGVSWQIFPEEAARLLRDKDAKKAGRVMAAMLTMTKIDIKGLEEAYGQG